MSRVLAVLLCLYNIKSLVATTCSGNQITWVNKNSTFVRCSPCPQCPPGQEFTLACHTKVLEGTVARCIKCPTGKYSRFFDTKPCVHCKTCSKRYVKRACTLFRNTECGDCRPGYYYSDVVFDCIECEKCCRDGKDAVPTGCKKVGMCKPRSNGCPKNPTTKRRITGWIPRTSSTDKSPTSNQQTTKAKVQPLTKKTPSPRTTNKILQKLTTTSPNEHLETSRATTDNARVTNYKQKEGNSNQKEDNNFMYKIATYVLIVVVLALAASFGYFIFFKRRERRTNSLSNRTYSRSSSKCSTSDDYELNPSANDTTLTKFEEDEPQLFEDVCIDLNRYRKGRYDFDRISCRLEFTQTEKQALLNNVNQNPTKDLFGILNTSSPGFTVKEFAKVLKDIKRVDVYQKLKPFFERKTME